MEQRSEGASQVSEHHLNTEQLGACMTQYSTVQYTG